MFATTGKPWDLYAFLSGIFFLLSFSPYDYWYFSIPALTVLFLSWFDITAKRATFRGFLFGLGLFCPGLWWVYVSIHHFGGAGVLFAVFLSLLFASFWALFPALSGYLTVGILRRSMHSLSYFIPATIWVLVEYLRGNLIFNGFPLYQIAYSLMDSPLAGIIPISGAYGAGWAAALCASCLACFIRQRERWTLLILPVLILISGSLLSRSSWTEISADPLQVTMIQGNVAQDKKWQPKYRDAILASYKKHTNKHWDSDIIIWPESSVPAFYDQIKDDFLAPIIQEAKTSNTDLLISMPFRNDQNEKFNAVMAFGSKPGIYKKIHLLPFGEYIPLQSLLESLIGDLKFMPIGSFTPGSQDQPLLSLGGYPVLTNICYEDAFGNETIARLNEAAFIVNLTNDGWFGETEEPYQHMQLARMRALETGRYLLRSTNNGVTAIIAPNGKIVQQAPLFEQTTLTGNILPMHGYTPYTSLGDSMVIILMLITLIGSINFRNPKHVAS